MPSEDRAIELARGAFVAVHGGSAAEVMVVSISKQQIPNPPPGPGHVDVGLVRYRYFIQLRSPKAEERYRVEGGNVYRG